MASSEESLTSLDLASQAQYHLDFLKKVDGNSDWLHQNHVIRNAIRRYETIWLPLVAKTPDLIPPLDVHWVWHVHMLCPVKYAADCMEILGTIPDHCFMNHDYKEKNKSAKERTLTYWHGEPYDVDYENIPVTLANYSSKISYDILAASERQKGFYYNVSLPHFSNGRFLDTAFQRYKMFVRLKKDNRDLFLVPMYDIDLIWHTHQLCPLDYRKSMETFLGYVMGHDDSTTDRSAGSKLTEATEATRKVWENTFPDQPYAIAGTRYRGSGTKGTLCKPTDMEECLVFKPTYRIQIQKVEVSGNVRANYKLQGTLLHSVSQKCDLPVTQGTPCKWEESEKCDLPVKKGIPFKWEVPNESKEEFGERTLLRFRLTSRDSNNRARVGLQIDRRDGIRAVRGKTILKTEKEFTTEGMGQYFKGSSTNTAQFSLTASGEGKSSDIQATMHMQALRSPATNATLRIKKGNFEERTLAPDDEKTLGPVPLWRPLNVELTYHIATHKVLDYTGRAVYSIRVIHSVVMRTSIVLVYYSEELSVVAHLIGSDHLPDVTQSYDAHHCLDPARGERAMLIKNNDGDWGIVKACWDGFKRGKSEDGIKGRAGRLKYSLTELESHKRSRGSLNPSGKNDYMYIDMNYLDLKGETIELDKYCWDIGETIAAFFSACVLYVLCEPRYNVPGQPEREVRRKAAGETIPFFRAVGYRTMAPSNSWLYWESRRQHLTDRNLVLMHEYGDGPNHDAATESSECQYSGLGHTEEGIYCPWGADGFDDGLPNLSGVSDDHGVGVSDSGGGGGGCGGCVASFSSDNGGGWGGDSGGGGDGGGGGASSCGAASSGGGGGGGGCGASCGSSCGGGGGGGGCGSD